MAKKVSELFGKKHRSEEVKEAKKGHDFGKKNGPKTGFKAVERSAEKEGHSAESAKRIAAAAFWRKVGKH